MRFFANVTSIVKGIKVNSVLIKYQPGNKYIFAQQRVKKQALCPDRFAWLKVGECQ